MRDLQAISVPLQRSLGLETNLCTSVSVHSSDPASTYIAVKLMDSFLFDHLFYSSTAGTYTRADAALLGITSTIHRASVVLSSLSLPSQRLLPPTSTSIFPAYKPAHARSLVLYSTTHSVSTTRSRYRVSLNFPVLALRSATVRFASVIRQPAYCA